jgi:hypothetical protein
MGKATTKNGEDREPLMDKGEDRRDNHEIHEIHEKKELQDNAFVLEQGMVAKVHKQAQAKISSSQIVVYLGSMFVGKIGHGLDFHDNQVKTKKVWLIFLLERPSLVAQDELSLRYEGNPP